MKSKFYAKYQLYSQEELFNVVLYPENFQPEAVATAKQLIQEKEWTSSLITATELLERKRQQEEAEHEQHIIEKAEYYKQVVEFKNEKNSFQVRIADIAKFEAQLAQQKIEYFREDKNIGVQLDSYPTQTYYFKNENVTQVDEITRKLGLITAPYADIKPFFSFELKVVLIVLVVVFLLFIFLS